MPKVVDLGLYDKRGDDLKELNQLEAETQAKVVNLLASDEVDSVVEAEEILGARRTKPKEQTPKDTSESHPKDRCQTPYYATDIITPYIPAEWRVWEPARGKGYMVDRLQQHGLKVVSGDILDGQNFFDYEPDNWDCLITNPPFSTKYEFLQRCYDLGKPFALLMPFEAFLTKTALALFKVYGIELVVPDARIDYEMPYEGYIPGNAPFASMWFTWGFGLPNQINYAEMDKANIGPLKISDR
jgi:hypothetical protein